MRPASTSALQAARALRPPRAEVTRAGDAEHAAWWAEHDALLASAWAEYGRGDAAVYELRREALDPAIASALNNDGNPARDLRSLRAVAEEITPGVYALPLFRRSFCEALLAELSRMELSGIPMRRPNGMNRHGAILSDLGFGALLDGLAERVVGPLGRAIYPEWCGPFDCAESYGFCVRYAHRAGGDVELAEHSDTANVTLNVCLGREFEGGNLYFKGVRFTETAGQQTRSEVAHRPGWALLHLGGHVHGALPLESGERVNLILWCQGPSGTVRIRPHLVHSGHCGDPS